MVWVLSVLSFNFENYYCSFEKENRGNDDVDDNIVN